MLNKEAAAYFVKDKSARELAESMMRGANAPDVVASLTLVIEAYGKACATQERARWRAVVAPMVQLWDDGGVFDSAVLRRFVRAARALLD